MRVDATSIGLIFSAVSTLVVIIGALAALRQLRHMRHGNELSTLTDLTAQFDTPEMHEALTFVRKELASAMHDPTFVAELRTGSVGPRVRHVTRVANYFELVGIYVHYRALSTRMPFTLWGVTAASYWELMRDAIFVIREDGMVLGFFEDFAMRSSRWMQSDAFRKELAGLTQDRAGRASFSEHNSPLRSDD